MTSRQQKQGWRTWAAHAAGQARSERQLLRVAGWLLSRHCAVAFSEWREAALLVTRQSEAVALVGSVVASWLAARGVTRAFASWAGTCASVSSARLLMQRCARHMLLRGLSAGWVSWCLIAAERRSEVVSMRRVLAHLSLREVSACWNTWAAHAAARGENMRQLRRVAGWLLSRECASAFSSWRQQAQDLASGAALAAAVQSFSVLQAHTAFQAWVVRRADVVSRREAMHRGVSSMTSRQQKQGWRTWAAHAAGQARSERQLLRVAGWLLSRHCAVAFSEWREAALLVTRQSEAVALVGSVVALWLAARGVTRAFASWAGTCASVSSARLLMQRCARHMLLRGLSAGWVSWCLIAAERRSEVVSMRRVLAHLSLREVSACWNTWAAHAAARGENMRQLRRVAGWLLSRECASAFSSWRQQAQDLASGAALAAAVQSFSVLQAHTAFHAWVVRRADVVSRREAMHRGVSSMTSRQQKQGWRTWAAHAAGQARSERQLLRVAGWLLSRHCAVAFSEWREAALLVTRQSEAVALVGSVVASWLAARGVTRAFA